MRLINNHNDFRKKIVLKLNEKLNNMKKSSNLEKGIYNWTIQESDKLKLVKKWTNENFVLLYLNKLKTIFSNIEKIKEFLNLGYKSQDFAFMTHQELDPKRWKKLIDEKIIRDKNKFEVKIEASTDTFTCRRCKQNKCVYYQLQTRSADEQISTYVSCLTCDNKWKC